MVRYEPGDQLAIHASMTYWRPERIAREERRIRLGLARDALIMMLRNVPHERMASLSKMTWAGRAFEWADAMLAVEGERAPIKNLRRSQKSEVKIRVPPRE